MRGLPRLDRLLFALGDEADEIAVMHHRNHAGQLAHCLGVKRGELRAVRRRTHNASEQHAGQFEVLHEARRAGDFVRDVEPRGIGADDGVARGGLGLDSGGRFAAQQLRVRQLPVGDLADTVEAADYSVLDGELVERDVEPLRCFLQQQVTRFGACISDCAAAVVDRAAAGGVAFVRRQRGVACHHAHARQCNIEFLGCDLRHRGDDTLANLDLAGVNRHAPIRIETQPLVEPGVDDEAAGKLGGRAHVCSSFAARCTALMMRTCVPQRHRLRTSASLISPSLGSEFRASKAAAVMMTPLMQ